MSHEDEDEEWQQFWNNTGIFTRSPSQSARGKTRSRKGKTAQRPTWRDISESKVDSEHEICQKGQPVPFEQWCASETFKFVVGAQKKEFSLHSELVALQSPKLKALIHGGMKESQERCVHWQDLDIDTFYRFGQFIYTGSYNVTSAPSVTAPHRGGWVPPHMRTCEIKLLEATQSPHLWPRFKKLYQKEHCATTQSILTASTPIKKTETHAEVFLSHAKVYVFADYHCIDTLRALALQNVYEVLKEFGVTTENLGDIAYLTRYCFENTSGAGDDLADMVGLFAACYLPHLWKSEEFRVLVEIPSIADTLITLALTPGQ